VHEERPARDKEWLSSQQECSPDDKERAPHRERQPPDARERATPPQRWVW
jgi:hypothetical protein